MVTRTLTELCFLRYSMGMAIVANKHPHTYAAVCETSLLMDAQCNNGHRQVTSSSSKNRKHRQVEQPQRSALTDYNAMHVTRQWLIEQAGE